MFPSPNEERQPHDRFCTSKHIINTQILYVFMQPRGSKFITFLLLLKKRQKYMTLQMLMISLIENLFLPPCYDETNQTRRSLLVHTQEHQRPEKKNQERGSNSKNLRIPSSMWKKRKGQKFKVIGEKKGLIPRNLFILYGYLTPNKLQTNVGQPKI